MIGLAVANSDAFMRLHDGAEPMTAPNLSTALTPRVVSVVRDVLVAPENPETVLASPTRPPASSP
jgi:hypothetical protein